MSSYRMRYKIGNKEFYNTVPDDIHQYVINKRVKITTSQTWTAPYTGWYKFTVKGAGGGGASAYIGTYARVGGSGGGEGGTSFAYEKMEAGDTATIIIGAGGAGGSASNSGFNGGDSSITVNNKTVTSGGGKAGVVNGYGSDGGSGDIKGIPGSIRSTAFTKTDTAITAMPGNGGGAGGGSLGFDGVDGGGGAGGQCSQNNVIFNGNSGGNGVVWIEYFDPTL